MTTHGKISRTADACNPTAAELATLIAKANGAANPPRAKSRTCSLPTDTARRILRTPQGVIEDDGGAVPNSYKYQCETSHVVAAWWTDACGRKYVRIIGARVNCRHASFGASRGCATVGHDPWSVVFPQRAAAIAAAHIRRAHAAMARVGRSEHEEWYTEQQRLRAASTAALSAAGIGYYGDAWKQAKDLVARVCDPRMPDWEVTSLSQTAAKLLLAAAAQQAAAVHAATQPTDDAVRMRFPRLIGYGPQGQVLIADDPVRPSIVQVAVRDATTGARHHITVPPKFARRDSKTFQRLLAEGGMARVVQAAVAWTFGLGPDQYRPQVEA